MGTASSRQAELYRRAEGYQQWLLELESMDELMARVRRPQRLELPLEDGHTLSVTRWQPRQQPAPEGWLLPS